MSHHSDFNSASIFARNFFHDPLLAADVLVMGMILYHCDLATNRQFVKEAYDAQPNGGRRNSFR